MVELQERLWILDRTKDGLKHRGIEIKPLNVVVPVHKDVSYVTCMIYQYKIKTYIEYGLYFGGYFLVGLDSHITGISVICHKHSV